MTCLSVQLADLSGSIEMTFLFGATLVSSYAYQTMASCCLFYFVTPISPGSHLRFTFTVIELSAGNYALQGLCPKCVALCVKITYLNVDEPRTHRPNPVLTKIILPFDSTYW